MPSQPLHKNTPGAAGKRPRSASMSEKLAPARPAKVTLSKCPCQESREESWKLECTNCKQIWHALCANISATSLPEKAVKELGKTWQCPWCFTTVFLRPKNHPSSVNESKLFGTVVADTISQDVLGTVTTSLDDMKSELKLTVSESLKVITDAFKEDIGKLTKLQEEAVSSQKQDRGDRDVLQVEADTKPVVNPTKHIEGYKQTFLTEEESKELTDHLSKISYTKKNGRKVASFGEQYQYPGAPSNTKEIPAPIKKLVDKIQATDVFKDVAINQIVINEYSGNESYLPEHSDDEPEIRTNSLILGVTLGSTMPIVFRDKCGGQEKHLEAVNGSLYAMSQESQYYWSHRIDKATEDNVLRHSITLRSVGQNYKNSLIILGDSNTKYLKFGAGEKGTFGYMVPGKRVETFHIRQIDPSNCIGYQKVLIHCGINDIRDKSPGRDPSDPHPCDMEGHLAVLSKKIGEVKELCPYATILVSPILPTKSYNLNQRALQFNSLLFDHMNKDPKYRGLQTLDLNEFVDRSGTLREELGCWDSERKCYNTRDILHLGRQGVRTLANVIRNTVLSKKFRMQRSFSDVVDKRGTGYVSAKS